MDYLAPLDLSPEGRARLREASEVYGDGLVSQMMDALEAAEKLAESRHQLLIGRQLRLERVEDLLDRAERHGNDIDHADLREALGGGQ
jgi:hypothetical protein